MAGKKPRDVGNRDRGRRAEKVTFNDGTMAKVYFALASENIVGPKAIDVVNAIQNEGILFRERGEEDGGHA